VKSVSKIYNVVAGRIQKNKNEPTIYLSFEENKMGGTPLDKNQVEHINELVRYCHQNHWTFGCDLNHQVDMGTQILWYPFHVWDGAPRWCDYINVCIDCLDSINKSYCNH